MAAADSPASAQAPEPGSAQATPGDLPLRPTPMERRMRRLWIFWRRLRSGRFDIGALLRPIAPRSLFGRSLIIIITPMVLLQAVVTYVFFERHADVVTRRLSFGTAGEVAMVVETFNTPDGPQTFEAMAERAERTMGLSVRFWEGDSLPEAKRMTIFSVLDRTLKAELQRRLEYPVWLDTGRYPKHVDIRVGVEGGVLRFIVGRKRVAASGGPIFVLWMVGSSIVLIGVAMVFLRNQVRPIARLAEAAEGFGKGREVASFRPAGAREIRMAAVSFLNMKDRIERHIAQRTTMLAGVSHDLRTPLTRLKLELAMLESLPEAEAMRGDVAEMERMLDEYLAFARGQTGETPEGTDLAELLGEVVQNAEREGHTVRLWTRGALTLTVRRNALSRAITNLVSNAARHGTYVEVKARRDTGEIRITVDDNGPGIPENRWEEAFKPFHRLDEGRNLETGGVGLGLAVSRDIVRGHGGDLSLDHSALGGLRALIRLPQ